MPFRLTEEQENIVTNNSQFLAIKAFAGSGKTYTLREFAKHHKDKRILYIAYNNETAKQARSSFPNNVTGKTAHSLAYSQFGYKLEKKLNRKYTLPFKPETIRKLFGFEKTQHAIKLANELFDIINNFCFSSYRTIQDAIPFMTMSVSREEMQLYCETIWEEMTDPDSRFPTTPDVYLKQFHLSSPKLNYDYILFDEAQDANPLILDLILGQKKFGTKLVFVGDEHQSIYLFRGAKNSLGMIKPNKELYLTKSFRFGKNISYAANAILKVLKNEKQTITGFEEISDSLGNVDKTKPFAVITRTNSNLFMTAINAYEQKLRIFFVGGFESYNFKKILDIEKLYLKDKTNIKDNYIKTFECFDDYKSTANYTNDREMLYYIKVVEKYAGQLSYIINGMKSLVVNNKDAANIILSTVHKSKGLEFSQVILANDFPNFVSNDLIINHKVLKEDEINILYVAATRAINVLKPNKTLLNIIRLYKEEQNNLNSKSSVFSSSLGDITANRSQDKPKPMISNIKNLFD